MMENNPFSSCYLILTEDCNLRCKYCYENTNRCKEKYMSFNTAKKSIDFLIDNAIKNSIEKLKLTFFGGEPLLNLEVMVKLFRYTVDKANEHNIRLSFSLITNGTIYNKQFEEFILEWYKATERVNIQISIDGIPEVQDKNRRTINDKPTSEIVFKNMVKLKKFFEKSKINTFPFHTHSVITKDNISKLFLSYKYFTELGINKVSFVTSHEEKWDENDAYIYAEQLSLIADYVYKKCIETGSLTPYQNSKGVINPRFSEIRENTCSAGKSLCTINPDGDIYPCHRTYFYSSSFKLGNVFEGIIDNESRKNFFCTHKKDMKAGDLSCYKCKNTECKICMAINYEQYKDVSECNPAVCSMYMAKWNFMIETKKKFDKLSDKLNYRKCNETVFFKAAN